MNKLQETFLKTTGKKIRMMDDLVSCNYVSWLQNQLTWIPVEERLPAYDEVVLWLFESKNYFVKSLDKDEDTDKFLNGGKERITHWFPISILIKY